MNTIYPIKYHAQGQSVLQSPSTLTFTNADTYYKLTGTYSDNGVNSGFTTNSTGRITCNKKGRYYISGNSEISVSNNGDLTYGLYKNGVLVPGAETPHTFQAASRTENVSIIRIVDVEEGDYFEVFAKYTNSGVVLDIKTFAFLFMEI